MSSIAPLLHAESLTKKYPGPPEVIAMEDICLDIWPGEYVAVTGASGSGKTTLLSVLGLLELPTSGVYRVSGLDVSRLSDDEQAALRARHFGFVFQAFHLLGYRTARENVEMGLLNHGVDRKARAAAASDVLERVGLGSRANALCSHLSGGEKQRVAVARALVRQPAIVLCDEPTGNLDSASTKGVLALLQQLHEQGVTILLVTHDASAASQAQRHVAMSDGHLIEP